MDPVYAQGYEELFRRHWWFRARSAWLDRELADLRPAGGFGPVLDVGCGNGLHFPLLRRHGAEPEGVEPDASLVTPAGRRHGVIHTVPFDARFRPAHRYALVLMLDVLEHLPDAAAALAHAASLLAPGGRIVVTVPAFRWLWTAHDDHNRHVARYTRPELLRLARRCGLAPLRAAYLFGWLVPVKLAVRAKEALAGPGPTLPRMPPAPLDRFFYGLTLLEQRVWGRRLPAGTTVSAVLASAADA